MASIYFWQGKILIRNGKIAMDSRCCCQGQCCCGLDGDTVYHATITAPGCSAIDGMVIDLHADLVGVGGDYCEFFSNLTDTIPNCTTATVPIKVELRCNRGLTIRSGEGECDRYELNMYYEASPCTDVRKWDRVELGCSCSPLNLVFIKPAPSWNGTGSPDCDCCEDSNQDITVTVTL